MIFFFFFLTSQVGTLGKKKGTRGAPKFVIIINIGMSTFEELSSISLNTETNSRINVVCENI